jgi:hypothetical protein
LEEANAVSFGGLPASSVKVFSPTSIQAVLGSGASGLITVSTPVGTANAGGFVFIPPPVISSLDPVRGGPGTIINIFGEHLLTTRDVSIGGKSVASFNVVSATHIVAIAANGSQPGSLVVTTAGGEAVSNGFRFLLPPVVSSFSPQNAIAGIEVIITGSDFIDISGVSFGGKAALSFKVLSPTSISAIVAPASGSGSVSVFNPGGMGTAQGFNFNFTLPSNNFSISTTDLTCRGSMNGLIKISALASLIILQLLREMGGQQLILLLIQPSLEITPPVRIPFVLQLPVKALSNNVTSWLSKNRKIWLCFPKSIRITTR